MGLHVVRVICGFAAFGFGVLAKVGALALLVGLVVWVAGCMAIDRMLRARVDSATLGYHRYARMFAAGSLGAIALLAFLPALSALWSLIVQRQ